VEAVEAETLTAELALAVEEMVRVRLLFLLAQAIQAAAVAALPFLTAQPELITGDLA
jgi:hypothetical protein